MVLQIGTQAIAIGHPCDEKVVTTHTRISICHLGDRCIKPLDTISLPTGLTRYAMNVTYLDND